MLQSYKVYIIEILWNAPNMKRNNLVTIRNIISTLADHNQLRYWLWETEIIFTFAILCIWFLEMAYAFTYSYNCANTTMLKSAGFIELVYHAFKHIWKELYALVSLWREKASLKLVMVVWKVGFISFDI